MSNQNDSLEKVYKNLLNDCHDYISAKIYDKNCVMKEFQNFSTEDIKSMLIKQMNYTKDACGQVQDITSFSIYSLIREDLFPHDPYYSLEDVMLKPDVKSEFIKLQQLHTSDDECLVPDLSNTLATLNLENTF